MASVVSTAKKTSFQIDDRVIEAAPEENVLEACLRVGHPVEHSCGGMGSCGTCRVFVMAGLQALDARNEVEAEMAADRGFNADERLSCQTIPVDGLKLKTPRRPVTAE